MTPTMVFIADVFDRVTTKLALYTTVLVIVNCLSPLKPFINRDEIDTVICISFAILVKRSLYGIMNSCMISKTALVNINQTIVNQIDNVCLNTRNDYNSYHLLRHRINPSSWYE
jgi:hypothetical protein